MLVNAFVLELRRLGWVDGRNIRIDSRWAGGSAETNRRYAEELVALAPDVIMAAGNSAAGPLLRVTRSIPIVFTIVPDPVGAGLVDSLARPGGNATGFTSFAYDIGGKWLELLKEIAPRVTRLAVIRDSATIAGVGQWSAIQTAAPSFGMEASPINLRDARELERTVSTFARSANGGLIVTSSGLAITHRGARSQRRRGNFEAVKNRIYGGSPTTALALFGRRPQERVDRLVNPASENLRTC